MLALEFRRAGRSYREIAQELGVDVHTAHADVGAELAALREKTIEDAEQLRDLELQRADAMIAGLWPEIQAGPRAISAAVRVCERRSRLLGLDAPAVMRTEVSGSLAINERVETERRRLALLTLEQMQEIASDSQRLVDKMTAMGNANAGGTRMPASASASLRTPATSRPRRRRTSWMIRALAPR